MKKKKKNPAENKVAMLKSQDVLAVGNAAKWDCFRCNLSIV